MIALRRRSPFASGREPRLVFAAFAGVRFAADAIHGDRQRLVRFLADRAEGHRAGREALHDFGGGFDLVERHGRAVRLEIEHAAQHQQIAILLIHDVREFPEALEFRLPHGVLQLAHGRRDSAGGVRRARDTDIRRRRAAPYPIRCGGCMANSCFISASRASTSMSDALDARSRAGEIALDQRAGSDRSPRKSARPDSSAAWKCPSSRKSSAGPCRWPSCSS